MQVILLVEDNDGTAKIYSNILKVNGYAVHWLTRASQALNFIKYTMPDLAILDLALPDMNGLDLIQAMRIAGYAGPAIAVSGELSADESEKDLFDGVYTKPIRLDELLEAVRHALPLEIEPSSSTVSE